MKILHVTKKYPDALGGDAVVVSNLQKQQKLNGHKIVILTSNCDEIRNSKHLYKFGLKDAPSALDNITLKRLISLITLFFIAFRVLKAERPDVIHTHSVDMVFFISFAARYYRIPVVHTFHIVTFYDKNQSSLRRMTELLFVRGAKPKVITAPNDYDVRKLISTGFNAELVPNGIDLDFWKADLKVKKSKDFTFLSVGRLEGQKGLEYLVKAAAVLKIKTRLSFRVVIVGEGSLKGSLQQLANENHVQDLIKFTGRKSAQETRTIYATADAFILSSLYETTPLTVLEAWALKLPVIATEVGILRGLKKDEVALSINKKNERSIGDAMLELMSNSNLRHKLGTVGFQYVKNYSWSVIAGRLEEVYQREQT